MNKFIKIFIAANFLFVELSAQNVFDIWDSKKFKLFISHYDTVVTEETWKQGSLFLKVKLCFRNESSETVSVPTGRYLNVFLLIPKYSMIVLEF